MKRLMDGRVHSPGDSHMWLVHTKVAQDSLEAWGLDVADDSTQQGIKVFACTPDRGLLLTDKRVLADVQV